MHDVVTVALITGLTGAAGSAATYFATKRQADRQADTDRERINAESQRMRIQYDEEHNKHRQVTYHDLLTHVASWHRAFAAHEILTIPEWRVWLQDLEGHFSGVSLFCSEGVFATLGPLKAVIEKAGTAGLTNTFTDEYEVAFGAAVEAMRKDTAPGF